MDPVAGILGALKVLGDLAKTLQGKEKERLEIAKERMELVKDQVVAITGERDKLKQQYADLLKEAEELRDWKAFHDISDEYELSPDGVLYRKDTKSGPYCPKDKVHMVRTMTYTCKCPICGIVANV